uniref:G_PROTEIN_RECEP_F1_2 domain-containing protein n=1 Tax=Caenorhabditis tropicalis TaxID=1561998 RepID=A0A1I7U861_9PELO
MNVLRLAEQGWYFFISVDGIEPTSTFSFSPVLALSHLDRCNGGEKMSFMCVEIFLTQSIRYSEIWRFEEYTTFYDSPHLTCTTYIIGTYVRDFYSR